MIIFELSLLKFKAFHGRIPYFVIEQEARNPKGVSVSSNPFPESTKRVQGPKIIKKYGNRKLYDTEQSSYVVLKDLEKMIRNKEEIQVIDNETQDDITISTLTQIIFSSEKKSKVCPPINVLKSIIREGDGSFSSFLAKLGLFSEEEAKARSENLAKDNSFHLQHKLQKEIDKSSVEKKITHLMSSGDEVQITNNEESIPELPGSRLC